MQKLKDFFVAKKERSRQLGGEFKDFLREYSVIGLAVGVVMGTAVSKFISAFVNDLVMPFITLFTPTGNWRTWSIKFGSAKFLLGDFLGTLLDFAIIALVVFLFAKYILRKEKVGKL